MPLFPSHDIQRFDSGAQGEHKVPRGFRPTLTYSVHYLAHSGFKDAVKRFLVDRKSVV